MAIESPLASPAKLQLMTRCARIILGAFLLGTTLAPVDSTAAATCEENFVAAPAIQSASDIKAFVICAAEYVTEHGTDEALRAFNDDPRWGYGPYYVFVHLSKPSGDEATTLAFPPEQWREGTNRGVLLDNFGNDYYAEAHRVVSIAGQGWIYYEFTNFESGIDEPKQTYLIGIDWNGQNAIIGAGIHRRDLPGSCNPAEVNAAALEARPYPAEPSGIREMRRHRGRGQGILRDTDPSERPPLAQPNDIRELGESGGRHGTVQPARREARRQELQFAVWRARPRRRRWGIRRVLQLLFPCEPGYGDSGADSRVRKKSDRGRNADARVFGILRRRTQPRRLSGVRDGFRGAGGIFLLVSAGPNCFDDIATGRNIMASRIPWLVLFRC